MRALILLVLLGIGASPVWAVEVTDLYETELLVSGQGRTERHNAVRQALAEVVIKVSGNEQAALLPGVPGLLDQSLQLLQQYRYRNEVPTASSPDGETQQWLWMRFNQQGLDKALRAINIPVWGRTRPSTVLWLVVDQGGQRRLLGGSDESELLAGLRDSARRRGIPLVLPLLDLEDQQRLKATDVWINFQETILAASQRYAPEAILVGRLLELDGGRWQARWSLNLAGQLYDWSHTGLLETALNMGVEGTASTLVARFVRQPLANNQSGLLRVRLRDIRNLADFARGERYLRGLSGVTDVQAGQIDAEQVLFTIKTRGDRQGLLDAVRLSSQPVLQLAVAGGEPRPAPPAAVTDAADIVFRLLP